jgi:hypothetical protein
MWNPLVGDVFAEKLASGVQLYVVGNGLFALFLLCSIPAPLIWPSSSWPWVVAGTFGVAAVLSMIPGLRALTRTSKEIGALVRANGMRINHDPGTQSVPAYRRWLTANSLDAEQVRRALVDRRPDF